MWPAGSDGNRRQIPPTSMRLRGPVRKASRPELCPFTSSGTAKRVTLNCPVILTARVRSHSSEAIRSTRPVGPAMPAFVTTTSSEGFAPARVGQVANCCQPARRLPTAALRALSQISQITLHKFLAPPKGRLAIGPQVGNLPHRPLKLDSFAMHFMMQVL